jgi:hypothetical protein
MLLTIASKMWHSKFVDPATVTAALDNFDS